MCRAAVSATATRVHDFAPFSLDAACETDRRVRIFEATGKWIVRKQRLSALDRHVVVVGLLGRPHSLPLGQFLTRLSGVCCAWRQVIWDSGPDQLWELRCPTISLPKSPFQNILPFSISL